MKQGTTTTLIERVSRNMRVTKSDAEKYVKTVLRCIEKEIVENDRVQLTGYLTVEKKERKGESFGKPWSKKALRAKIAKRIEEQVN